jgi:hypothetical protein
LVALLDESTVESLPHEQIIERLDEAGRTFRSLVIKTTATVPYTSLFLRLDCAYWTDDAERKLRTRVGSAS